MLLLYLPLLLSGCPAGYHMFKDDVRMANFMYSSLLWVLDGIHGFIIMACSYAMENSCWKWEENYEENHSQCSLLNGAQDTIGLQVCFSSYSFCACSPNAMLVSPFLISIIFFEHMILQPHYNMNRKQLYSWFTIIIIIMSNNVIVLHVNSILIRAHSLLTPCHDAALVVYDQHVPPLKPISR